MNEFDAFDRSLAESLEALPPDAVLRDVTPWRQAMDRIVLGLCLTCFTLNFLYLQYLLPAVGAIQLYLGFRALRNNNRWFRIGWYFSIYKAILLYSHLALLATPFAADCSLPLGLSNTAATFLLFVSLRQALRQAVREMGRAKPRDPALWACVWYEVMIILGLLAADIGWPGFLSMIAAFVCIVRALNRASAELEEWGYTVTAAPVKLDAAKTKAAYLGSLAAVIALLSILSCHVSLDGTVIEQNFDSPETTAIRTELADLGFPKERAAQLLPEDLALLTGAVECRDMDGEYLPLGNDQDNIHENRCLALLYPDGSAKLIHFFSAGEDSTFWLNNYTLYSEAPLSNLRCRLLWTRSGQPRTALLPAEYRFESGLSYFGDRYQSHYADIAPFSWPLGSQDRQGYLIVTADQEANPKTSLSEKLMVNTDDTPRYPYEIDRGSDWSYGNYYYLGDGSGLTWKADEEANRQTP